MRMLYHNLVLPNITIGVNIWFGAADTVLELVIVLQKQILRVKNSLPFNVHTGDFTRFRNNMVIPLHNLTMTQKKTGTFEI